MKYMLLLFYTSCTDYEQRTFSIQSLLSSMAIIHRRALHTVFSCSGLFLNVLM